MKIKEFRSHIDTGGQQELDRQTDRAGNENEPGARLIYDIMEWQ